MPDAAFAPDNPAVPWGLPDIDATGVNPRHRQFAGSGAAPRLWQDRTPPAERRLAGRARVERFGLLGTRTHNNIATAEGDRP